MAASGITGIILAGGQSRRMGQDKAFLPWGKTTLIEHVIERLRPVTDELIVAVKDARAFRHLKATVVEDCVPDLPAPRRGKFFVCVLKCADGSFYIGQTDDIPRRLKQHQAGDTSWTSKHAPVEIIHWEEFDSRKAAVKREQEFKTGFGRTWLKRAYAAGRLAARQAGAHALGGLCTGLRAACHERCFVCACDTPFVSPELVSTLAGLIAGYDLVIPRSPRGLEPLHAVYVRSSALPAIEGQLRQQVWELLALASTLRVRIVEGEVLRRIDPAGWCFVNLNTEADYAMAEAARIRARPPTSREPRCERQAARCKE